ncbi:MAG: AMP-binding protein [Alphaproteobacteria bacterium]|nr:AMP-binding protein [Alphaproteobacteria bacterium]
MTEPQRVAPDPETPGQDRARAAAERLLETTRALLTEINPRRADRPISLDSLLDKDIGFDSLGRVELMARAEQAFGVTLSEEAMTAAETPRDILRGILAAEARLRGWAPPEVSKIELAETSGAPATARTLIEALRWHAERNPERPHIRLYADEGDGEAITYRELAHGAERVAAGLQGMGIRPDETVALMLPTGREYFLAFFGVLFAGAIPASLYPPLRPALIEDHLKRCAGILDNAWAAAMITTPEIEPFARLLKTHTPSLRRVATLEVVTAAGGGFMPLARNAEDIAFLQYTSGSTGNPKGVVLTHANLLANVRAMGEAVRASSADVFVSWLPLYHDMGLIGAWLGSLYYASPLVVMPPMSFIARPERWLRAIHRYRGTLSAAPNFAFNLCLRRIEDREIAALDLSSWRCAFNGAEAVSAETVERFVERFAPAGFRRRAMMPVYGLAENSVGLAFPPLERGPAIDEIDRDVLMRSARAEPAKDSAHALRLVACGQPIPNHQIRIAGADGRELPERREGRIQFRGPSATGGYFRAAEETKRLFSGEWLETGDLGYVAEGDLYITGRTKDMIIRAGRNIYPVEIEEAVGNVDGVRTGAVAVFGIPDREAGTERLVVMAETRAREDRLPALRAAIDATVTDLTGLPPDDIALVAPNTVLKTSSGKIRRAATRALYEKGAAGKGRYLRGWHRARLALDAAWPLLRRIARIAGDWAFGVYAWTLAVLAALAVIPVLILLPAEAARWAVLRGGLNLLARLAGIPFAIRGLENLPPAAQPCIFAVNHMSYLDGFVMAAAIPRIFSFVAKAELKGNPLVRVLLGRIGAAYVRRTDKEGSLQDARRLAEQAKVGRSLLYFPEGTLTRAPGLLPFRVGAFEAAIAAGLPVVPIAIRGTRSVLRDGTWRPQRGPIIVTIEQPLWPADIAIRTGGDPWATTIGLRDAVRNRILRHCGEPDAQHERAPL